MQNELFYVGYRELFEKQERKGYTTEIKNAGKFSKKDAESIIEFNPGDGFVRWMIPCDTLDRFNGKSLCPKENY